MVTPLTKDQLTLLRLARGDSLPRNPFDRPQTRYQDRHLLFILGLIVREGATFVLTPLGAACLERIEAELAAGDWEHPDARRAGERGGR